MNEVKYSHDWECAYSLTDNLISRVGGGGNLISGDGFYREYNSLNQLVRIRNGSSSNSPLLEQYYYDPFNERIKVWRNDTAGTTIYTPFREFMQVRNSSGVYNFTYVYDGSTLVARIEPDGSVHYYHPDHLGSTTLITDQGGNVVEETFYEPFGLVTSGGMADVKLYTGQFSDELTNQYYYGARYYIPSRGKFGQPDPVIQNVYDPQFLNHYSYARNNPYLFVDPDGREVTFGTVYVNNEPRAAVYASGSYQGYVVNEQQSSFTFPVYLNGKDTGYSVETTAYDYGVQSGGYSGFSEREGLVSYYPCLSNCQTQKLSDIYYKDQANPFKSENLAMVGAVGDDALKVIGAAQLLRLIKLGGDAKTVYDILEALSTAQDLEELSKTGKVKRFFIEQSVPGSSTYYEATKNGYKAGDKVEGGSGGGGGWNNVIPDPSGRKDKRGKPVYTPRNN